MTGSLSRRAVFAWVVLATVALALLAPAFLLGAAPVFALLFVLSAGWFPGEAVIARLRDRRARQPRRGTPVRVPTGVRATRHASRLLICFSLANRPPPACC